MEIIKNLYHQYCNQSISWYNGLEQLYQYGVLLLLGIIGLFIMSYLFLSRITR